MIRRALATLILALVSSVATAQEAGENVTFQDMHYIVMAAGTEEMTATATGESIVIVIEMTVPVAVIVPDAGVELRLDPAIPMLWLDGEEYSAFVQNRTYLQANAAGKSFALLEFDRAAN